MSNSTDIPSNDMFNQIADVFLTTPSVVSDHPESEDLRYPPLNLDHDDTCHTTSASFTTTANDTPTAPSSFQKSTENTAPRLTLTEKPCDYTGTVSPPIDDDSEKHPDHTSENTHSPVSSRIDNLLSNHTDSESIDQITTPEINLSLLYACHLPVQGRLWYGQLAAAIAAEFGSTCFLRRLGDDAVSADLFPAQSRNDKPSIALPDQMTFRETDNSADGIIRSVLPFTKHWLLHVQNIEELTQSHAENDITPNRIILATSTDPAAMVGAYRTLKNIVEIQEEDTAITLLFIGTDHESARRAFNRIASAAHGFLNRTISCLAVLPKMEPVRMTHLGVFPYREPDNQLNNFTMKMCQTIDNANFLANSTTETNEAISFEDEIPVVNEEDILDTIDLNEPPTSKPDTVIEENDLTNNHRSTPPQLVTIVPELTDLIARSPKAPGVELAIDADGCVHALYTDTRDDHSYCEDDCNPVASLLSVCDWIEDHSNIIRLLRSFPASQSSEMEYSTHSSPTPHNAKPLRTQAHLFTAHPQQYRRLMDGRLRIHLLAPVEEIVINSNDQNTDHPDINHPQPRWVHVPVN